MTLAKSDLDQFTGTTILIGERDSGNVAVTQDIKFTDFPLPEISLYLSQKVLMLPREY